MSLHLMIDDRRVGPDEPVYIVAEMSANHGHDFERAVEILHAASEAGADAVKLQTYTPDTMTIDCGNDYFKIGEGTIWQGRNLHDLYREAHTPWEWQPKLKTIANDLGLALFSTAFDASAVDFLEDMGVSVHKIASFENVDLPLIEKAAGTGKPLIISTGMASLEEIDEAVQTARRAGATQVALLKCTSAYPAVPEEMHLRTIADMAERFSVPVGLSDHTLEAVVPDAALALGVCLVEKHFTLSRDLPGPDSAFSLEPAELKAMVQAVRIAEKALGAVQYGGSEREAASRQFRRSLFITQDVSAGDQVTAENVRCIRPGQGLHPRHYNDVLSRRFSRSFSRDTPLEWDMLA